VEKKKSNKTIFRQFKNTKELIIIGMLVLFLFVFVILDYSKGIKQSKQIAVLHSQIETLQKQIKTEKQKTQLSTGEKITDNQVETFKVARSIDGDTIKLENGQVVRYIGIDTPETVDPRKPVQCFGKEASRENRKLVEGKKVILKEDVSETDKYGRLLRYVYVGNIFVNDYLVSNGYASVFSLPPDIKYQAQFKQAEKEAKENKRGLWADNACKTAYY